MLKKLLFTSFVLSTIRNLSRSMFVKDVTQAVKDHCRGDTESALKLMDDLNGLIFCFSSTNEKP